MNFVGHYLGSYLATSLSNLVLLTWLAESGFEHLEDAETTVQVRVLVQALLQEQMMVLAMVLGLPAKLAMSGSAVMFPPSTLKYVVC